MEGTFLVLDKELGSNRFSLCPPPPPPNDTSVIALTTKVPSTDVVTSPKPYEGERDGHLSQALIVDKWEGHSRQKEPSMQRLGGRKAC